MKTKIIYICLNSVLLILAGISSVYGQLNTSGTWNATNLSKAYPNTTEITINLDGNIDVKGAITIPKNYTLRITSSANRTIKCVKKGINMFSVSN